MTDYIPVPGFIVPPPEETHPLRKYPFHKLKEGEGLSPPFPWTDRHKVRDSMNKWNREKGGVLVLAAFPQGTELHPDAHVTVGWPAGVKASKPKARKPRGAKAGPISQTPLSPSQPAEGTHP